MARSATEDPIEKFRFRFSVISFDLNAGSLIETAANAGFLNTSVDGRSLFKLLSRSGFSEITLPKSVMKVFTYRENIDAQRFVKNPGLASYEPISLKRGVTKNRDLYDWYRLVNEEMALLAVANELAGNYKFTPTQSGHFRRDVVIEVLDRKGEPVKGWYLFNAFPSSYKGGDDLNASAQEKLVEEMTLDYEFFLEFAGGLDGFVNELAKGAILAGAEALAGLATGAVGGAVKNLLPGTNPLNTVKKPW